MTYRWSDQRGVKPLRQKIDQNAFGAQFGWTPHQEQTSAESPDNSSTDRLSVTADSSESGYDRQPDSSYWDSSELEPSAEPARLGVPDTPETELTEYRTRTGQAETTPPLSSRLALPDLELYRRLPHLVVLLVAVAVLVSGGFWRQTQTVTSPGGTDTIESFTRMMDDRGQIVASSSAGGGLEGYYPTNSPAITPSPIDIDTYVTGEGESIADIAATTGRSQDTLLLANDLTNPEEALAPGTRLQVPPTDGALHTIQEGETLEDIAELYSATPEAIIEFEANGIERSIDLVPGRTIMIPQGEAPPRAEVLEYTVVEGDTLWNVASRFNLNARTILWENDLPDSEIIVPGQTLRILPTNGVMVTASEGDTIQSLAETWNVDPSAIRDYEQNGLDDSGQLHVGQDVMIPGGAPDAPDPIIDAPEVASIPADLPVQQEEQAPPPAPEPTPEPTPEPVVHQAEGYFVWPTTGVITQYFHSGHNGWDIANRMYSSIWAADSGTVTFAGWNDYGLGYAVAVDHGNGYVTWYGHMAEYPSVSVGQWVNQGEYLGPMGSTGYSTGPHIHFVIVYNGVYQNPGNYLR